MRQRIVLAVQFDQESAPLVNAPKVRPTSSAREACDGLCYPCAIA